MRLLKLFLITCFIVFSACKSNKIPITKTLKKSLNTTGKNPYQIEILPNAKLFISKDNFNITKVTQHKGHNLVLKFIYKKQVSKNIADGNYREVLFIEIPNFKQNLHLTQFKNIKVWFARFCYCRDYVGYFKIKQGNLNLLLNKNYLKIKIQFSLNNIPQVLNFIDQKIFIK